MFDSLHGIQKFPTIPYILSFTIAWVLEVCYLMNLQLFASTPIMVSQPSFFNSGPDNVCCIENRLNH